MTSDTAPRTAPRRRLAAAGVGVLGALIVAEVAFRLFALGVPPPVKCHLLKEGDLTVEYHCYPSNPSGEFRPLPNTSTGRWRVIQLESPPRNAPLSVLTDLPWCVEYRRESLGVRGPAVSEFPAPGVTRFAGVGDSFALGDGVPYEKTLFAQLGRLLGPEYEFLNCAVSGVDTGLVLREIEFAVPRYHCTRALATFTLNDVKPAPGTSAAPGDVYDLINVRTAQMQKRAKPWYRSASRVAEFLASAAEVRALTRETVTGYLDAFDPSKNAANLALLESQFRTMAQTPGCRVGLVVYPMMYGLEGPYPLQPCHDEVVRRAQAAGLPVLDLAPAFAGQKTESLQVHPIDHHPNGRANEIAARAIAEWIRAEPTLRK